MRLPQAPPKPLAKPEACLSNPLRGAKEKEHEEPAPADRCSVLEAEPGAYHCLREGNALRQAANPHLAQSSS